jgi:hypothetical protein
MILPMRVVVAVFSIVLPVVAESQSEQDYKRLVDLNRELVLLQGPSWADGVPDYSPATIEAKRGELERLQGEWAAIDAESWPTSRKIDYLLVYARINEIDFGLRVVRSWSRDPGLYVDLVKRIPYTDTPIYENDLQGFRRRLENVPRVLEQARNNLTEPAKELAKLAIRHLERYDGVGQGEPLRSVPPEGTIGWYRDLIERLSQSHPNIVPLANKALAAVEGYRDWLASRLDRMTEPAWIGLEHYNWFLRRVRLMPYTVDDLKMLGEREFTRWRAFLAIEKNKNDHRGVPQLPLATSKDEYDARIREAERQIRKLMAEQGLLTIPDDTPKEFETDAYWTERPGGYRHFWEELQYRNGLNNHIHASIPGHRFDMFMRKYVENPIRATCRDGGRIEGWATYIEEMFLQAGIMDDIPRARELFYIALMKRAARVHIELEMQEGAYSLDEANAYLIENVPFMEENLGRYDLEGYLRRPAYGSAYLIGKIQLEKLLSDLAVQQGDAFDLGAFHDALLTSGFIPLSLLRWEMTGLDDEARQFWADAHRR